MDKMDFFVKDDLVDIKVEGQIFKYKPSNAGDELDWVEDYMEDKIEIDDKGKEFTVKKANMGKLSICKLRNIMEIPYTSEELEQITGNKKAFKDYTGTEKVALFRRLDPDKIYNPLIRAIDNIKNHKKKS
ncbi:MAG: hypothetical protein ACTSO3_11735 [Candidatus Heimdallarchaeaceae archaeon]